MPIPLPLRGLINFVDRALDPRTATRNARRAGANLAEHRRQLDEVERTLHAATHTGVVPGVGDDDGEMTR